MPDTSALYQEVILDHNRRPRNYGRLMDATLEERGINPLCGDELTLWLRMDGDRIAEATFTGSGCAISRASASMMTGAVKGKTRAEAEALIEQFRGLATGRSDLERLPPSMRAFAGVARLPQRVKCAVLAWHTLHSALAGGAQ
ncbi:MAG: SUF system NifU family Fe-S cluster assembly protein, partial [Gemmatimonadaceae bacterium]|nr:SUF system NifU family Fe-S cluster assembly protein [Gemmatimonadaceae bacterium]